MTAKEYLSQIEAQTVVMNNLENEIKRLIENAKTISSPNYSVAGSTCGSFGSVGKYKMIDSSVDLLLELFEKRAEADRKRLIIISEIHRLDNAKYIKL
ncbi:MAG: hypothetical protein NC394_08900, partial [Bacteroides sp.]|nr:hypothetical protein [Bacteroides sp.]